MGMMYGVTCERGIPMMTMGHDTVFIFLAAFSKSLTTVMSLRTINRMAIMARHIRVSSSLKV
jgi:hypothetical protein